MPAVCNNINELSEEFSDLVKGKQEKVIIKILKFENCSSVSIGPVCSKKSKRTHLK